MELVTTLYFMVYKPSYILGAPTFWIMMGDGGLLDVALSQSWRSTQLHSPVIPCENWGSSSLTRGELF